MTSHRTARSRRRPPPSRAILGAAVLAGAALVAAASPALAWTPKTQQTIAWEAARLVPPDLVHQILKHRSAYLAGALQPFDDADPTRHRKSVDGSGNLDRAIDASVTQAVTSIRTHRPFEEIVYQLGIVSHYIADANNPLAASTDDPQAARYFIDYLRYAETAEPRFPLVFYGLRPSLDHAAGLSSLVTAALSRGRSLYPMIGFEYRQIDYDSGIGVFDDRSTAFAVASVAFSHAVTDVALAIRYIWLRAGGADQRSGLPAAGGAHLLVLPRAGAPSRTAAGP